MFFLMNIGFPILNCFLAFLLLNPHQYPHLSPLLYLFFTSPDPPNTNSASSTESIQPSVPNKSVHSPVIESVSSPLHESLNLRIRILLLLWLTLLHLNVFKILLSPSPGPVRPANVHPMVTRAKYEIVQPRINPTLLLAHAEPKSVKQDLHDPKWLAAMKDEFDALERNHTWSLVPLSQHRSAIGCKWVFRIRENSDVSIKK